VLVHVGLFRGRGLVREGFAVVVARDLTDVLHDPRESAAPPLSHAAALEAVVRLARSAVE